MKTDIFLTELEPGGCPEDEAVGAGCVFSWYLWASDEIWKCPTIPIRFGVAVWDGHAYWIPHPVDDWLTREYGDWRGPRKGVYGPCDRENAIPLNATLRRTVVPSWMPSADAVATILSAAAQRLVRYLLPCHRRSLSPHCYMTAGPARGQESHPSCHIRPPPPCMHQRARARCLTGPMPGMSRRTATTTSYRYAGRIEESRRSEEAWAAWRRLNALRQLLHGMNASSIHEDTAPMAGSVEGESREGRATRLRRSQLVARLRYTVATCAPGNDGGCS